MARHDVAVKVLQPHLAADTVPQARFRLVARTVIQLSGAGIAPVHDYGEAAQPDGTALPYLVRDLVGGPTLEQRLAQGPLPAREALRIVAAAAAALAAAHQAGVAHGHLVPANIVLGPDGVQVTDFGLWALHRPAGEAEPGGLAYTAPELASGGPATPAADMYALGVVFVACLAGIGAAPGAGGPPGRAGPGGLAAGASLDAAALDAVPPGLAALWAACLGPGPDDRPSAAHAAVMSRQLLSGQPAGDAWASASDQVVPLDRPAWPGPPDDQAGRQAPAVAASPVEAPAAPGPVAPVPVAPEAATPAAPGPVAPVPAAPEAATPAAASSATAPFPATLRAEEPPVEEPPVEEPPVEEPPVEVPLADVVPMTSAPGPASPRGPASRPSPASRPGPGGRSRSRPSSRRRRVVTAGGAATGVAAAAVVGLVLASSPSGRPPSPAAAAHTSRAAVTQTSPGAAPTPEVTEPRLAPTGPSATAALTPPSTAAALTPLAAVGQLSQTISADVAAGQMRSDVAQDFANLIQPVRAALAQGSAAPVGQLAVTLRAKLWTRVSEGAVTLAAADVLNEEITDLARSASSGG
jgi:eukaryotic-like serine/threonine-protein kinase